MRRRAGALLIVAALVASVMALRDATMSSGGTAGPGTAMEVVVRSHLVRRPQSARLEMTTNLIDVCGLEISSEVLDRTMEPIDSGLYRFWLRPAPGDSDEREFRGCLEDARVDHLQLDVLRMQRLDMEGLPEA